MERIGTQITAPVVIQDDTIPAPSAYINHIAGGSFKLNTLADLLAIPEYYRRDINGTPLWGMTGWVHSDTTTANNGEWELIKGLSSNDVMDNGNWRKKQQGSISADDVIESPDRVFVTPAEKEKINNDKGHFDTEALLRAAYPTGESGWYAVVETTNTFWVWNTGVADWTDSGNSATSYVHPNHTGEVTSIGDGAQTITPKAVTNPKLADMAANTLKGAIVSGEPQDLTATQARTILNVSDGANNYVHPDHGRSGNGDAVSDSDGDINLRNEVIVYTKFHPDVIAASGESSSVKIVRADDERLNGLQEIADDSITDEKLAEVPANTIKGAIVDGNPTNLVPGQVRTIINVEDGATADQTAEEIATLYEGLPDRNQYNNIDKGKVDNLPNNTNQDLLNKVDKVAGKSLVSDTEIAKLATVEEGATDDQTGPEIRDLLVALVSPDKLPYTALEGLEAYIQSQQLTAEEIATLYEGYLDVVRFTTAKDTKLTGIETGATKNSNTDELTEGSTNQYFTNLRAISATLAGYVKAATVTAITSATTILQAIGILEKALDNKVDKVAGAGLITDAEKAIYADKYTKVETDNKIDAAISDRIWKPAVATKADLYTTYSDAVESWTASVNDEDKVYRYDGVDWRDIGNQNIPLASPTVDGKMSSADFVKLSNIEVEATKNDDTDSLAEGATNLYFTDPRAVAAVLAGYTKSATFGTIQETDSISQALGILEKGLDGRLAVSGETYIATTPGANAITNGTNFLAAYNQLKTLTPGGNPISADNQVTLIVMPGFYDSETTLELANYVNILGFGGVDSTVIDIKLNFSDAVTNIVLEGFSTKNYFTIASTNSVGHVLRRIKFLGFFAIDCVNVLGAAGTTNGLYEDITSTEFDVMIFSNTQIFGTFRRITIPDGAPGLTQTSLFSGTIDNVQLNNNSVYDGATITNCEFISDGAGLQFVDSDVFNCRLRFADGASPFAALVRLGTGNKLSYCIIDATGYAEAINSTGGTVSAEINHCLAKGTVTNITNTVNGFNSWDTAGSGGGLTPEEQQKVDNLPLNTNAEFTTTNAAVALNTAKVSNIDREELTYTAIPFSSSITITIAANIKHIKRNLTLTGNAEIAFSGLKNGDTGSIYVTQDTIGGRTLTPPAGGKGQFDINNLPDEQTELWFDYNGTDIIWRSAPY